MPTVRVCPQCGGRSFSSSPPSNPAPSRPSAAPTVQPPYSATPPSSVGLHKATTFEVAGHWRRVAAYTLDLVILTLFGSILYALALLLAKSTSGLNLATALALLVWIAIPYIYFTALHSGKRSATWGKAAVGLVLATEQGERLTQLQAFIRILLQTLLPVAAYIVLFLSFGGAFFQATEEMRSALILAIIVGFLAIAFGPFMTVFFNPRHQTLFDLICKTRVIKKPIP
jgi:uncharacterized RDD family membrane protein YckC